MNKVKQNGGPINYKIMGASLVILRNLLVPQLEQNNNPNAQVQHVLILPATMVNIPTTFTNSNRTTRKNMSEQLNFPSAGNIMKDEYKLGELRLKFITLNRDKWTIPDKETFQWCTHVMEMHKLPGETLCGCRTWYFHPAHEVANTNQRTNMYQHIKKVADKTKALVKSSFNCQKTGFAYKRNDKDPVDPVRLETVTVTDPNNSRIVALLTIGVLVNRTAF